MKHGKNKNDYDIAHIILDKELTLPAALLITNTSNGYFLLIFKIDSKTERGLVNS